MRPLSYSGYRFPPEIIQHAIWLYLRFTLSFRDVEELLAERGIDVSHETIRRWVVVFGPMIDMKLLALYAGEVLEKRPGSPIIFEVKCSQGLVEWIEQKGGTPVMWKAGHSLIKAKMRETGAPLGGEMSGHMFFADEFPGYDDALYGAGRLLRLLAASETPLSARVRSLPQSKYVATPELRLDCADAAKFGIVDSVREYYRARYPVIDIDGVRVQFGDGWALVRASNTQPVLVLRFEAKSQARLQEITRDVYDVLARFPEVTIPALST